MAIKIRSECQGYVYFIQAIPDGPIKIGWCGASLKLRMATLRTTSPVPLDFLGVIRCYTRQMEYDYHVRFGAARLHGEWFEPTAELLDYIAKNTYPVPEEEGEIREMTPEQVHHARRCRLKDVMSWAVAAKRIQDQHDASQIEYYI